MRMRRRNNTKRLMKRRGMDYYSVDEPTPYSYNYRYTLRGKKPSRTFNGRHYGVCGSCGNKR